MGLKDYLNSLKILILDDDVFFQDAIGINLEELGIGQFENCLSGKEALNKVESGQVFDVMLVDLKMPEMDGIEAVS